MMISNLNQNSLKKSPGLTQGFFSPIGFLKAIGLNEGYLWVGLLLLTVQNVRVI